MWEDRSPRYKNLKTEKNVTDRQTSEGNNTTSTVPQTTSAHEKYSRSKNVQNIHVQPFKLCLIYFILFFYYTDFAKDTSTTSSAKF